MEKELLGALKENGKIYSRIVDNMDEMTPEEYLQIQQADVSLNKTKTTIAALEADGSLKDKDRKALIKQTLEGSF